MLKRIFGFLALVLLIGAIVGVLFVYMPYSVKQNTYPLHYSEEVERYSEEFGVDKALVYAVIKVESNFEPSAVSHAGAIGLMQIIEDSFDWVKKKLGCDDLVFEDMYTPEYSIRFGCYMLDYLYEKYGSIELVAAAYHCGMTTVDNWIEQGIIDPENIDISKIEGSKTQYYVKKIMRAYDNYSQII
ncbi:MAG: lytic transglycosylase domain-containing protein [Oscillospiraceae bacterium]|nr:lytic transglycosylase domain-containing protein [Oscillospiraceae bacterium]